MRFRSLHAPPASTPTLFMEINRLDQLRRHSTCTIVPAAGARTIIGRTTAG